MEHDDTTADAEDRETADTEPESSEGEALAYHRYAAFSTEDGVVIYDTSNGSAWIQSDASVEVSASA